MRRQAAAQLAEFMKCQMSRQTTWQILFEWQLSGQCCGHNIHDG